MSIEDRLVALEEEYQLLRGEIKQTLGNVRDFLLELNLPAIEEEEQRHIREVEQAHAAPGNSGFPSAQAPEVPRMMSAPSPVPYMPGSPAMPPSQPQGYSPLPPNSTYYEEQYEELPSIADSPFINMSEPPAPASASSGPPPPASIPEPESGLDDNIEEIEDNNEPEFDDELTSQDEDENLVEEDEDISPIDLSDDESALQEESVDEVPETEFSPDGAIEPIPEAVPENFPEMNKEMKMTSMMEHSSHVNLLTNLIRWVNIARVEIGMNNLPVFLDVYSIGDEITDELREVILYLARTLSPAEPAKKMAPDATDDNNVTQLEKPEPTIEPNGEIWNRMILELHGILRSGPVSFKEHQLPWKRLAQAVAAPAEKSADIPHNSAVEKPEPDSDTNKAPPATEEPDIEPIIIEDDELDLEPVEISNNKARSRKTGAGKKSAGRQPHGARLKLVLPIGAGEETEIDIGEFNLNLNRTGTDRI